MLSHGGHGVWQLHGWNKTHLGSWYILRFFLNIVTSFRYEYTGTHAPWMHNKGYGPRLHELLCDWGLMVADAGHSSPSYLTGFSSRQTEVQQKGTCMEQIENNRTWDKIERNSVNCQSKQNQIAGKRRIHTSILFFSSLTFFVVLKFCSL